jgi:hypothetical protein
MTPFRVGLFAATVARIGARKPGGVPKGERRTTRGQTYFFA